MKRMFSLTAIFLLISGALLAQDGWMLDRAHSFVKFQVEHIVVLPDMTEEEGFTMGFTQGHFRDFTVKFHKGAKDYTGSRAEVLMSVNSIDTDNSARDAHLRSPEFFNAEMHPWIRFATTAFEEASDGKFHIKGDLTIKDVTRPIEMEARYTGGKPGESDNGYISFAASTVIFRNEFGLVWSEVLERGGFRVSNYVELTMQVNFVRSDGSMSATSRRASE